MDPFRVGFACPCNSSVQMKLVISLGHCIVERGGCYLQSIEKMETDRHLYICHISLFLYFPPLLFHGLPAHVQRAPLFLFAPVD
ncbi:hypothetical protein CRYUN_Cryun23aG0063600 [Craigia yunnanensis]